MTDSNNGHQLPQSSQGFTFVSMVPERREPQRNYVFVDEKNRHRRIKVVRACEGCRKRKIKCDAANTNTWPCSACLKQKMTCVPPSLSFDSEDSFETDKDPSQFSPFQSNQSSDSASTQQDSPGPPAGAPLSYDVGDLLGRRDHFSSNNDSFFSNPHNLHQYDFSSDSDIAYPSIEQPYMPSTSEQMLHNSHTDTRSDSDWRSENSDYELTEALGDLKISDTAVASYIVNQRDLADAPAVQEEEIVLPQQSRHDSVVRIPEPMMPFDTIALDYFRYFFDNIHPYVPVLYPPYFYRQWHRSKASISPLILEGIFASASYMMEQKTDTSSQWLALASKHEESFRDVPRLSTLQGLLLLLKAREALPRRGYFYRSWMLCVNMVAMAKDLGLDSHCELHERGQACDLPSHECVIKTRVWNTLYVVELMIGGPQGRTDYGVPSDTVDFDGKALPKSIDEKELQISRQFTSLMRIISNIRETLRIYSSLRKKKTNWANDPEFVQHDAGFAAWLEGLPQQMRITFPNGSSPPWLPSHFVANVHSYHRLAIIMHHRPQLQQAPPEGFDGSWKTQMMICYEAAKELCRLQEAVMQQFGLAGLLCMQRGISFTIYAVLTCTMLHLVAVTSPDPDINTGAADYFVRQMRLLEQCSPSWPMKEMQVQIESLRQAFSADVSKPFELRPNFLGSPPPRSDSSSNTYLPTPADELQLSYASATTAQPSNDLRQSDLKMPEVGMLSTIPNHFGVGTSMLDTVEPQTYWNPSRIISQWDTAFGLHQQTATSAPSGMGQHSISPAVSPPTQVGAHEPNAQFVTPMQGSPNNFMGYSQAATSAPSYVNSNMSQVPNSPPSHMPSMGWSTPPQPYVTPRMWQRVVATAYGEGQKRRWNDTPLSMPDMPDRDAKRMR